MKSLENKREKLFKKLLDCKEMLKGNINEVCSKCARMNCKCTIKARAYRLSFTDYENGKPKYKTLYIPKHMVEETQKRINQFRTARDLISELIEINRELFKLEAKR